MKKFFRILIIVIVVAIIGYVIYNKVSGAKQKMMDSMKVDLKTYKVIKGEIVTKIDVTGEIQPETTVQIKSKVSGKIVKFYKDINDHVNEGDLIATIEIDYNQARSITSTKNDLDMRKINLDWAKRDFDNAKEKYENDFLSEYEYDQAAKVLHQAQLNYDNAKEQYEQVDDIDINGKFSKIYSSVTGTVIARTVEEGEMVSSIGMGNSDGTPILKVADLSKMVVKSNINEIDINKYQVGQTAKIIIPANPYEEYNGKITQVAAMATTVNAIKVFPIEIELLNVDKNVRPGMSADITIQGESKNDIVIVPIASIFSNVQGQDIVYLVENGKITGEKVVVTGINNSTNVEIVEGLDVDTEISLVHPSLLNVSTSLK